MPPTINEHQIANMLVQMRISPVVAHQLKNDVLARELLSNEDDLDRILCDAVKFEVECNYKKYTNKTPQ